MKRSTLWINAFGLALLLVSPVWAGSVSYFLVAERPGERVVGDSYVMPIANEEAAIYARQIIRFYPDIGLPIVFGYIAPGADGINRNLTVPGQPLWNWHVTGFGGFNDRTTDRVDGTPTYVNNNIKQWMTDTLGFIGFKKYTIVAELKDYPNVLPPVPVPLPMAALGALAAVPMFIMGRKWLARSSD